MLMLAIHYTPSAAVGYSPVTGNPPLDIPFLSHQHHNMAAKKANPGFEFIVAALKKNPKATYKDIAAAAAKKKMKLFPVMFGRAQAMLGIVKQAARGKGKAAKAKAKAKAQAEAKASRATVLSTPAKRGPGRPRKNAAPTFDGSLEGIVAAVKSSEQAKARYRGALEKIHLIIADALTD